MFKGIMDEIMDNTNLNFKVWKWNSENVETTANINLPHWAKFCSYPLL